jgi:hypothetical protein
MTTFTSVCKKKKSQSGKERIIELVFTFADNDYPRRYSQTQSPGSSIPDFIKDDSFVLISRQSGSYDLDKEICSLIGLRTKLSSLIKSGIIDPRLSSVNTASVFSSVNTAPGPFVVVFGNSEIFYILRSPATLRKRNHQWIGKRIKR